MKIPLVIYVGYTNAQDCKRPALGGKCEDLTIQTRTFVFEGSFRHFVLSMSQNADVAYLDGQ
jgi:hypothetical protein